jgi:hypothetical protein
MPNLLKRSRKGVVKISVEKSAQLAAQQNQVRNIVQFFRESPLVGVRLDLKRDKDPGRQVQL